MAMIDHTDLGDQPAGTTEVLHYLHDVLGSVVALTNWNGAVVERYDYDPYGATYILDPAGVPLQLLPVDPWAADGYFHDHDQDGDLDAADYTDLMACANDTPYDPLCIYTHDRNGDRRVDLVDVGAYLAHADSNGLIGPSAGMANFGRPLRLPFDADGDGRIDLFDWYALQTCYDRATTRCTYLFDADASAAVDGPDLDSFRASAEPPYSGPPSKPWRRQLVASRYGNPFMWTGQRYDATTGQYHFWARTYSPRLGRWLQRDPFEYVDGPNPYSIGFVSPIVFTDPFGLSAVSTAWAAAQMGRGIIGGIMIGAGGSTAGFLGLIWDLTVSPVKTVNSMIDGILGLYETVVSEDAELEDILFEVMPHLYQLIYQWDTLTPYDRGLLIGQIVGEYGVDILAPGGAVKLVNRLKAIRKIRLDRLKKITRASVPGPGYVPAPKVPAAFPDLIRIRPKGGRKRWKDADGNIYEWDYQHGRVEKYDKRGHHLGEYDPDTGAITKEGDPGRCIEP